MRDLYHKVILTPRPGIAEEIKDEKILLCQLRSIACRENLIYVMGLGIVQAGAKDLRDLIAKVRLFGTDEALIGAYHPDMTTALKNAFDIRAVGERLAHFLDPE